jgi:hypothetical protein
VIFVRVGSYISHIELEQCPVIHQSQFEARRAQKGELYGVKESGAQVPGKAVVPTIVSTVDNQKARGKIPGNITNAGGAPLQFDDKPKQTSWEEWGEHEQHALIEENFPALIKNEDFPALPSQDYKNGGSKVPDLLTGTPDKLDEKNVAWITQKEILPYLPKPVTPRKKNMATMGLLNPVTNVEEEFHPYDPDNPTFNTQDYYNSYADKYRCPWPGCT